jgi:hypothetical protein
MKRFLLLFLSAPTVLMAILPIVTAPESAIASVVRDGKSGDFCVDNHARLICVKSSQISNSSVPRSVLIARAEAQAKDPDAFVNFSYEESDAAAAIFGCDCPACLRSLRQLRIMAAVS